MAGDVVLHRRELPLSSMRTWTFVTHHAHVLLAVARDPGLRVREVAEVTGITERSAYRILSDLVAAGYLRRARVGRRNRYELAPERPLDDPVIEENTVSDLLSLIRAPDREPTQAAPRP